MKAESGGPLGFPASSFCLAPNGVGDFEEREGQLAGGAPASLSGEDALLSPCGSARGSPAFSDLWEAWKDTACCLHGLSRVAAYPSASAIFGPALGIPPGAPLGMAPGSPPPVLPPHFSTADKTEYPNAKAVLSYRAFKKVGQERKP